MRIAPALGLSRPAATFSNVDLPQPVGPTTETNSPWATHSVTSFTAVYALPSPPAVAKAQVMRSNSTAAVIGRASRRMLERTIAAQHALYRYFACAFFTNELSKVVFRSILPAAITDGSNLASTL